MKLSERTIIKISFIIFILCFMLLYYMDLNMQVKQIQIVEISIKNLNEYVAIKATIIEQTQASNHLFLVLKDKSSQIDGVIFNTNQSLEKGEYLFLAKVSLYNNKINLIIDEIKNI